MKKWVKYYKNIYEFNGVISTIDNDGEELLLCMVNGFTLPDDAIKNEYIEKGRYEKVCDAIIIARVNDFKHLDIETEGVEFGGTLKENNQIVQFPTKEQFFNELSYDTYSELLTEKIYNLLLDDVMIDLTDIKEKILHKYASDIFNKLCTTKKI